MTGPIDDGVASVVCAQLLFLESENSEKDIFFYINSLGGAVTSALAIYDTMEYVHPDVATLLDKRPLQGLYYCAPARKRSVTRCPIPVS